VQRQLNAAGFNAGPEDGLLGSKTRTALKSFINGNDYQTTLDIHSGNAIVHCRHIGLSDHNLQKFWPSAENSTEIVIADEVDPKFATEFTKYVAELRGQYSLLTKAPIVGVDTLVVASDPKTLKKLIIANSSGSSAPPLEKLRRECNAKKLIQGAANLHIAYFCLNPDANFPLNLKPEVVREAIAHELVHLLQYQIAGRASSKATRLDREGPVWLVEGSANVFGNFVGHGVSIARMRNVYLARAEELGFPKLDTLESRSALKSNISGVYKVGSFATTHLVSLHGYSSIGDYFEALGRGTAWEQAFKEAFGENPKSLYDWYNQQSR